MPRLAPSVTMAQSDLAVEPTGFFGQSNLVVVLLLVVVVAAIMLVANATAVVWSLVAELLEGLWAGVKAIALLLFVLACLLYLLVDGGLGPG